MSAPTYRTLIPLFEELHDERVIVRPYREEDAQALFDAINESRDHIRPWLPFADQHQSVEETRDWINTKRAQWILREDMGLSIWEKPSGRFLGGTGLHVHSWEPRYFEIGYWLRVSAEGHGYLTAALKLLVRCALDELGVQRLEIRCDERNVRSAAVARRLGFTQKASLRRDSRSSDGSVRNTLIFGLLPGDPAARR